MCFCFSKKKGDQPKQQSVLQKLNAGNAKDDGSPSRLDIYNSKVIKVGPGSEIDLAEPNAETKKDSEKRMYGSCKDQNMTERGRTSQKRTSVAHMIQKSNGMVGMPVLVDMEEKKPDMESETKTKNMDALQVQPLRVDGTDGQNFKSRGPIGQRPKPQNKNHIQQPKQREKIQSKQTSEITSAPDSTRQRSKMNKKIVQDGLQQQIEEINAKKTNINFDDNKCPEIGELRMSVDSAPPTPPKRKYLSNENAISLPPHNMSNMALPEERGSGQELIKFGKNVINGAWDLYSGLMNQVQPKGDLDDSIILIDDIFNDHKEEYNADELAIYSIGRPGYNYEQVYDEVLKPNYKNSGFGELDRFLAGTQICSGTLHVIYVVDLVQLRMDHQQTSSMDILNEDFVKLVPVMLKQKKWIVSILFTNRNQEINKEQIDPLMKQFTVQNPIFNSDSMNYFQTYDSSRTDRNFVREWIDSRFKIAEIDQEDKSWQTFIEMSNEVKQQCQNHGGTIYAIVSTVVHDQENFNTCFAYTVSTMIRAAEMHIFGRKPEDHYTMVKNIIQENGTQMGKTEQILQTYAEEKRLLIKKDIDLQEVSKALSQRRCVMIRFKVNGSQWVNLKSFFAKNPAGLLTQECLNADGADKIDKYPKKKTSHAAVIVGDKDNYYIIKNSYGQHFADQGYLKITKDCIEKSMFSKFAYIYPDYDDLFPEDIEKWKNATDAEKNLWRNKFKKK